MKSSGQSELALQLTHQVEHGALDRDVERGGDLVGDHDLRAAAEGTGQGNPLTLAAGELRRPVFGTRGVEVHQLEEPGNLGAATAAGDLRGKRLGDALTDRHAWVER